MAVEKDIENKILDTFADVASSIGYSPIHGKIIGILLVKDQTLSLQELAEKTGYSASMVSLSLDLLEVLGIIKKVKKTADRKLYVELSGDLLECLKRAILIKLEKSITTSLQEFEDSKKQLDGLEGKEKDRVLKTINVLEEQINRLNSYVKLLSKTRLP